MMARIFRRCMCFFSLLWAAFAWASEPYPLNSGWKMQSSASLHVRAEVLSQIPWIASDWYDVSLPTSVVGALVANKVYPDPSFGMNMRDLPGMGYPVGDNFTHYIMPPRSPFGDPWIFLKEFDFDPAGAEAVLLKMDGINYRANVWLNGRKIADSDDAVGVFRSFAFNVGDALQKKNVLVIELFPPKKHELNTTWVDWNPSPPDKNMGILKPITLVRTGPVSIEHPLIPP